MALLLTLPFPVSVNAYYRSLGYQAVISKAGRAYRKAVKAAVFDCLGGYPEPIVEEVEVIVDLFPPDRRRRDLDNYDGKSLFDALTHAGVWLDDSQVTRRVSEIHPQRVDGPAAVVYIQERA